MLLLCIAIVATGAAISVPVIRTGRALGVL